MKRCEVLFCEGSTRENYLFWFCKYHWASVPIKLKRLVRKAEKKGQWSLSNALWQRIQKHAIHVAAGLEP